MMIRMTEEQYRAHQQRIGKRGPDRKKRKEGSGQRKRYPQYEAMLASQVELAGLPVPEREYRFHDMRKWRVDLAYPPLKIAIEIDGAVHRIKGRFIRDFEKHQALFLAGWRLLRVSTAQVSNGEALRLIRRALHGA